MIKITAELIKLKLRSFEPCEMPLYPSYENKKCTQMTKVHGRIRHVKLPPVHSEVNSIKHQTALETK